MSILSNTAALCSGSCEPSVSCATLIRWFQQKNVHNGPGMSEFIFCTHINNNFYPAAGKDT